MSLSIEDLLNSSKSTEENDETGKTPEDSSDKKKIYLIPRYSVTHKQRNQSKEPSESYEEEEQPSTSTPTQKPIIRNYADTKWMRNRIETVVDAYKLTVGEAASTAKILTGK
jgi:hypothetical protein